MAIRYAPQELTFEECTDLGITFPSVKMSNGEYRFRCTDTQGYGYALTKMPLTSSGWQSSHYHKGVVETYIVQQGWIGFAKQLPNEECDVRVYRKGSVVTTEVNQSHNIYMSAGAVIHTVKHGDAVVENDWFADPDLDAKTKQLTEEAILQIGKHYAYVSTAEA
jgi:mannose-6-phosphate isomerase-like protein (cupin superfamily)